MSTNKLNNLNTVLDDRMVKTIGTIAEKEIKTILNDKELVIDINKLTPDAGYKESINLVKNDKDLSTDEKIQRFEEIDEWEMKLKERAGNILNAGRWEKAKIVLFVVGGAVLLLGGGTGAYNLFCVRR